MMARLRPFLLICIAVILSACASSPESTLGELPRTPQASTQQLLQEADASSPAKAALLRLSATDLSLRQGNPGQARAILQQIAIEQLPPAQQIFASTLKAELALADNDPQLALQALQHPAFERLAELPIEQQLRSQLTRAQALEAVGKPLEAARERSFVAPRTTRKSGHWYRACQAASYNPLPTRICPAGYHWQPRSSNPPHWLSNNKPSTAGHNRTPNTPQQYSCPKHWSHYANWPTARCRTLPSCCP